ncbi:MAG TPA: methyltransferase domain-containing protein [Euryarchaeota archaeon]|nr:methyltransferase domain-containing protein [Euryarchaeota archaeon]
MVSSTEDKIPLPGESVDIAFMANVLHEIDGDGTLREAHRILRHGGILVVVDWKKEKAEIGPPMEHRLSLKEAELKIKEVGLSPKDSFEIQPYHYCIVARK